MQILGQIWMQFNSLVDETWRGTRLVSHGGAVMGATAFLAMLPDHDLDVVVLANRPLDVESIAMQAAAAVLGDRIEAAPVDPQAADHADLLDCDFLEPETGMKAQIQTTKAFSLCSILMIREAGAVISCSKDRYFEWLRKLSAGGVLLSQPNCPVF